MKARDVMTPTVVTVTPDTPVKEVAALMLARRISGVPVVDRAARVVGIVSEGDLIRRPEIETDRGRSGWLRIFVSAQGQAREFVKTHGLTAGEVMTAPALTVSPEAPLADIARLMDSHHIKRVPVVENGKLVGLVTRADLLRALVARQAVSPVPASDQEIRERIVALLNTEDWAVGAIVNVLVNEGIVHLWGAVDSEAQREALIVAVRGAPGVKKVEAHLVRTLPG